MGAYLQMLGAFGELRTTNVTMRANHLFAEYSGVVGDASSQAAACMVVDRPHAG